MLDVSLDITPLSVCSLCCTS